MRSSPNDPTWLREVLGQYPTGVCVVTARETDGTHTGFVVGSFTSVSLNPPLIGFFPDKKSTSWPRIMEAGTFCVNILSAEQEDVCRRFAVSGGDKFAGVRTRTGVTGAPILSDAVAWIDCSLESVHEAGDHYVVFGRVRDLDIESPALPLLFFQGGYGRFAPLSLTAPDEPGVLTTYLRMVDQIRGEMESLAEDLSARCTVSAIVNDEIVVLASAGSPDAGGRPTLVGVKLPHVPPNGAVFAAWSDEAEREHWLRLLPEESRDDQRNRLGLVRSRGFSVGLRSEAQREFATAVDRLAQDPTSVNTDRLREVVLRQHFDPIQMDADTWSAVRVIASPVFDHDGHATLAFTLYGFARPPAGTGVDSYAQRVVKAAARATAILRRTRSALAEDDAASLLDSPRSRVHHCTRSGEK